MKNYLAIDYGRSHIGIAVAQSPLAEPLTQLKNTSIENVIKRIKELIEEEKIDTIILGFPDGELEQEIKDFAEELHKATNMEVIFHDENLSSVNATNYLVQSGAKKSKRQNKQHQTAAAIILQDYLDNIGHHLL